MRLAIAIAIAVAGAACSSDSDLTIKNESSFAIAALYMSSSSTSDWGPDLLEDELLEPGDRIEISEIECDDYDIKVIDEDGDDCVLEKIELCANSAEWIITDEELALCSF